MIDFVKPTVELHLKRGINICDGKSASGKSYLPILLRDYSDSPNFITIFSRPGYDNTLKSGIDADSDNIYFFDRADLLMTDDIRDLILKSDNAYIIIDIKKVIFKRAFCNSRIIHYNRDNNGRLIVK